MGEVITWPLPLTEKQSAHWALKVDQTPVPVWISRVREEINKPDGAGYTHSFNGRSEWCGFARFDFSGKIRVGISVSRPFKTAEIVPHAFGIAPEISGQNISFEMAQPAHLTVLLDGSDEEPLHIFARAPETDVPAAGDPDVVFFGPGEHWISSLELKSGQTLYLDGGAILRGVLPAGAVGKCGGVLNLYSYGQPLVLVRNAENVTIRGRGIIDCGAMPHLAKSPLGIFDSKNVRVEGIMLRNAASWHLPIRGGQNIAVDGVACLSGRLNTDGINSVNSTNVRVRNCFARTHDDSFVVKAGQQGAPCSDVVYENCIAWNDWGYALGMSYESRSDIHDVIFRNCHVLFARNWPLGVHVSDSGTVSRLRFENIHIDYPATKFYPEMGRFSIRVDNIRDVWAKDTETGLARDILFKDIEIRGGDVPPFSLKGAAGQPLQNIVFENVSVNGEKVTADSRVFKFCENVDGLICR